MYIVVYEYTRKAGLFYGNRFFIEHNDKKSVKDHPQVDTIVIAEGISRDHANRLVFLTPEICLFTGCLAEFEHITILQLPQIEESVRPILSKIRKTIEEQQFERIDATSYIAHFREMAKQDTDQTACLRGYLARITNQHTGQVMTEY